MLNNLEELVGATGRAYELTEENNQNKRKSLETRQTLENIKTISLRSSALSHGVRRKK